MISMFGQVTNAIEAAFPGVRLIADNHSASRYYIVKVGDKTVAYVVGRNKVRVQAGSDISRSVLITNPVQIPYAIEFINEEVQRRV